MIFFLLGLAALGVLMAAMGMFSRAQVTSIKQFGAWAAALGGLSLGVLLLLTGHGVTAISALLLLGPLVWQWMAPNAIPRRPGGTSRMSRAEALEILGLPPAASDADIKAAHVRLMRAAHPDAGGSDWLATRINQARDVLLG